MSPLVKGQSRQKKRKMIVLVINDSLVSSGLDTDTKLTGRLVSSRNGV